MFDTLIILLHFIAGIISLIIFLKCKKLLTKISLLVLGLSAIGLGLVHVNVLKMFQVGLFGIFSLFAFVSLGLIVFSEVIKDKNKKLV